VDVFLAVVCLLVAFPAWLVEPDGCYRLVHFLLDVLYAYMSLACLATNKQTNHGKKHIHLGFYTGTGVCGCSSNVLLMMGKMLPETC
jgi:hypothetical protein